MHLDEVRISVSLATTQLCAEAGGTRLVFTEQVAFLGGYDEPGSRQKGSEDLLDRLVAYVQQSAAAR